MNPVSVEISSFSRNLFKLLYFNMWLTFWLRVNSKLNHRYYELHMRIIGNCGIFKINLYLKSAQLGRTSILQQYMAALHQVTVHSYVEWCEARAVIGINGTLWVALLTNQNQYYFENANIKMTRVFCKWLKYCQGKQV